MKVRLLGHYQPATIRQLATYHQVEQVNDGDFSSGLRDADVFVARNHVNISTPWRNMHLRCRNAPGDALR